jgi:hypothetical protein
LPRRAETDNGDAQRACQVDGQYEQHLRDSLIELTRQAEAFKERLTRSMNLNAGSRQAMQTMLQSTPLSQPLSTSSISRSFAAESSNNATDNASTDANSHTGKPNNRNKTTSQQDDQDQSEQTNK